EPVTYTITVTNGGPGSAIDVQVSEGLTLPASVDSATSSQGSCTLFAHGVDCDLGPMANGAKATVTVAGTPGPGGTLTPNPGVQMSGGLDRNSGSDSAPVQTTVSACPFPTPAISAPVSAPSATGKLAASVSSGPGHADAWTLAGGTLDSGQGTTEIGFTSGAP